MTIEGRARDDPRRIIVIGAGVSGLAAAHTAATEARRSGFPLEVVVLERSGRVGGRAASERDGDWLLEGGPGGYLDTDARVASLVRDAGLEDRLLRAHPTAARRYILSGGRVHRVAPWQLLTGGLLGPVAMLRILGEIFVRPRREDTEESVRAFLARRFGARLADRIGRVAMLGIFAGDAERLSLPGCFPELAELEREAGSVIRGALRRRRGRSEADEEGPSRRLTSFRDGLRELPVALAAHPGVEVRTDAEVERLEAAGTYGSPRRRLAVQLASGAPLDADAVIIATSAPAAARLLREPAPTASEALAEIPSPPVSVVALGYELDDVSALPSGFGTLVARGEGYRMLGVLHESQIYPRRAPTGHALVRMMFGGRVDPEVTGLGAEELVDLAHGELSRAFEVTGRPVRSKVFRWPDAIPQYEIGHLRRRRLVERALAAVPGLFLAGDALEGVSFVKTARTGILRALDAVDDLLQPR